MFKFFFNFVKWKNMESFREVKFKVIYWVVGVGKVNFWVIVGVGLLIDLYYFYFYKCLKLIIMMLLV